MHVLVRYVSSELHPIQISFFRNAFGLLVFAPWLMKYGLGVMSTKRLGLHCVRAVLNVAAMFAYFTALSITPLARVTALGFTAPIFAALLSVVLLGERFRFRRWAALIIGFAGTLVILRPGVQAIDLGSMLVLISAVLWGVTMIVIKVLARTETSMTITGYMNLFLTILSFGPALYFWQMPRAETWIWLLLIGVTGTLAQVALAQALKEAEAGVVMPFDFLKLVLDFDPWLHPVRRSAGCLHLAGRCGRILEHLLSRLPRKQVAQSRRKANAAYPRRALTWTAVTQGRRP